MSSKKKPAKKTPKATPEKKPASPAPETLPVNEQAEPPIEPEAETPVVQQPEQADTLPESPVAVEPPPEPSPESAPVPQEATMPTVGDVLERTYKGKTIRVEVVEGGFRHEGTVYSSLSKLAKVLTGYKAINGRKFFNVGQAPGRPRGTSLQTKIKRIDSLIEKLRDALKDAETAMEKGKLELAEAETKRQALAEQAAP